MIKIKKLKKDFPTENGEIQVLKGIDTDIDQGQIYGIIGLSGAGKSTLLRCINRLEEPSSGKIFIEGREVTAMDQDQLRDLRSQIGMIFQHFNLFDQQTVGENIAYPLKIAKISRGEIQSRVDELLDFINLKEKKNQYPSTLSGGQKQRVAIARALANKPKILLSDEGTSALDPANTRYVLDLLSRAVKEFGLTVVMITHQMEVAKEICDRIAVMEDGKIIEENTVEELFRNPKTQRTKTFIEGLQKTPIGEFNYSRLKGLPLRLSFDSKTAKEPIISKISREFNVDINIISGDINNLRESEVGYLNIELMADKEASKKILQDLKNQSINIEVIK